MTKRRKKLKAVIERQKVMREGKRRVHSGNLRELPPNENLKKMPDEVYGDTEIPFRRS